MASSSTEGTELFANRYELRKSLGQGSAGKVYLAFDTVLGELVALKTLNEALTLDDVQVKRFMREVSVTRKVTHPNVVRTYDVGTIDSTLFFTMEHVPGHTLKERLAGQPLEVEQGLAVVYEICKGLHAIHESDIVHRDLKLTNIIVGDDGFLKISDFGVARPGNSDLTTNEDLVGTATHMAPEVWRSGEITKRTDLYSLGVLIYEIFAGVLPFSGASPMELMYHHIHSNPPSLSLLNPSVPKWIDSLAKKLLQKSADQRPASVEEVMYLIERNGEDAPESAKSADASKSRQSMEFSVDPAILNNTLNSTLRPKIKMLSLDKKGKPRRRLRFLPLIWVTVYAMIATAPLIASPSILVFAKDFLPRLDLSGAAFLNHAAWHLAILSALIAWPFFFLNSKRRGITCGAISFFVLFVSFAAISAGAFYWKISQLLASVPFHEVFGLNTDYLPRLLATYKLAEPTLSSVVFMSIKIDSNWIMFTGLISHLALITVFASSLRRAVRISSLALTLSLIGFSPLLLGGNRALSTWHEESFRELLIPADHALRLFLVWWLAFAVQKSFWKSPKGKKVNGNEDSP